MKSISISILFLLLGLLEAYATAQYPDIIIYKGREYKLHSNPMEAYFKKYPDKRPDGGITSTALWRGYVATFEVRDDVLFVKDIEIEIPDEDANESFDTKWVSAMDQVFPDQKEVKVDWLTGILVLPYGKMIDYVHMGYGSTFSKYILLEVEKGIVNDFKELTAKEYKWFKQKQFEAFKKTKAYNDLVLQLKNERSYDDEFIEQFLKDFVIDYTTKFIE